MGGKSDLPGRSRLTLFSLNDSLFINLWLRLQAHGILVTQSRDQTHTPYIGSVGFIFFLLLLLFFFLLLFFSSFIYLIFHLFLLVGG